MSQSLAKVYLHLIFSTKNRKPLLLDEWRDELFRVLGGTANNLGCQSLIVGGMSDHVHMLFQLGRTISMSEAISKIKSTSSTWINDAPRSRNMSLASRLRGVFRQSIEHRSSADLHLESGKNHAKQSLQDEVREWLRRYEIEWDERFVWDGV